MLVLLDGSDHCLYQLLEQVLLSWSNHVRSRVEFSYLPVQVIRYEDLLIEPLLHFKRALDFMGISCNDKQISLATKNSDFKIIAEQEREFGFKEKPLKSKQFFHTGKSSHLNNLKGDHHYESLKKHHPDIMKRYNYFV